MALSIVAPFPINIFIFSGQAVKALLFNQGERKAYLILLYVLHINHYCIINHVFYINIKSRTQIYLFSHYKLFFLNFCGLQFILLFSHLLLFSHPLWYWLCNTSLLTQDGILNYDKSSHCYENFRFYSNF